MVSKHLERLTSTDSELAKTLSNKIKLGKPKNLRKIKSESDIRTICNEVLGAVERLLLVHANEDELMTRKIKKQKGKPVSYTPVVHTEDDGWKESADLRKDWDSERWIQSPLDGWIYYDSDGSILGFIYKTGESDNGEYSSFLRKEIADNPIGAMILLRVMKERLKKVIQQK